ncbi:MAG: hypothetical protein K9N00_00455 [Candidatus Marinimicrobia bacterium]|nr:hypothetical protein [Candidatus Neomarinimicrobiota bacterium]
MKQNISFFIIIFLIYSCDKNKDIEITSKQKIDIEQYTISKDSIIKQNKDKRQFVESPKLIKKINLSNLEIYRPYVYKCNNGYLYIFDYSSFKIHKINLEYFKEVDVFGSGKGRGPGEFINVNDIIFDKKNIYISDGRKRTIEVYTKKGDYVRNIKTNKAYPHRVMIYKNQIVIYNLFDLINPLYVYNKKGDFIKKTGGPLFDKELDNYYYYESNIIKTSNNSFLQIPRILGLIVSYKNFEINLVKETIDGRQDPKHRGKPTLETAANSKINDNNLILYRDNRKTQTKSDQFFDIYNNNSLEYKYSFKIDKNIVYFNIHNNLLICTDDKLDFIYVYNIENL